MKLPKPSADKLPKYCSDWIALQVSYIFLIKVIFLRKQEACRSDSSGHFKLAFCGSGFEYIVEVGSNILLKITYLASSSYLWSLFDQIHMLTKSESRSLASQFKHFSNHISRKTNLLIILPNSYQKLTKSTIRSSWSWLEHCPKSIISPLGSHIWSLFASIHMTSWPR